MDPNSSTPIVVLKGVDSDAILPIWVGAFEANAIALEIEKSVPQRPMTHDLLRNFIAETGFEMQRVIVSDLLDNTFYAVIELVGTDQKRVALDARPSDAIALALRSDCQIFVAQKVLDASSSVSLQSKSGGETAETLRSNDEWPDLIT